MFSQVSVCPQGSVHGRGHAWWGVCGGGGMCGNGVMCGRGACMAGGSVAGGRCAWLGACVSGEMTTAASGTHSTGMHSCFHNTL